MWVVVVKVCVVVFDIGCVWNFWGFVIIDDIDVCCNLFVYGFVYCCCYVGIKCVLVIVFVVFMCENEIYNVLCVW